MTISTRRILSGLAGFALLAMPVGAAAGTSLVGFARVPLVQPTPPAVWTNAQLDEGGAPPPRLWYAHHEPDSDDYPALVCDEDGDDCQPAERYRCDEDGNDCRPAPRYRCDEDGDNCNYYGQPYRDPPQYQEYGRQYGAPSYYNGRPNLLSERQRLVRQRDYAQAQFHAARAAGERRLSARWASQIKDLNHRLAALDARAANAAYSFHQPLSRHPYAGYPSAGYPSAGYPPTGYPPAGSPYTPSYGANPNGTSALGGMINSLLGPSSGYPSAGSPPASSPNAVGSSASPNGTSALGSLLGSFMGNRTAP